MNKSITSMEKYELVQQFESMDKIEFSKILKSKGLYLENVKEWKAEMVDCFSNQIPVRGDTKKKFNMKITRLEKQLKEANALLELQKKTQALLGAKD